MAKTELMIHGHSCCEIRGKDFSIICDPWLVGSAYWRSWFNFPSSPDFDSLIKKWSSQKNIYFYITHLHWDHFHGPTIKKIVKKCPNNYKFLIPKTPEKRLFSDLKSIVHKNQIIELSHAKKYKLVEDLSILSFQSGPFFADSVISIFSKNFCLLNINDAKIFKLSMRHLLSLIPRPDYVLKSHSSANDRCCLRERDGKIKNYTFDKSRIDYSKEFFDICKSTNTKYAIPFASNMACLHKETFKYNSILNFSDYVAEDFKKLSSQYKDMKCKLLLPTEKILLENNKQSINKELRYSLFKSSREIYLKNYQNTVKDILTKQYIIEDKTKVNLKLLINYFSKIINSTPFFIRKYLSNNIYIRVFSKKESNIFNIDFSQNTIKESRFIPFKKNDVIINVNAYVINDVCRKSHWNSLGVSKRLEVWMDPYNNRYLFFNFLCNTIESNGLLPLKNLFSIRFTSVWIKRYREILDIFYFLLKVKVLKNVKNLFLTSSDI